MQYKKKARILINLIQGNSILTEREIKYESSHVAFLEKTLKNLKSTVNALRRVRNFNVQSTLLGITSRQYSNRSRSHTPEKPARGLNFTKNSPGFNFLKKEATEKLLIKPSQLDKTNGFVSGLDTPAEIQSVWQPGLSKRHNRTTANLANQYSDLKSIKSLDRLFTGSRPGAHQRRRLRNNETTSVIGFGKTKSTLGYDTAQNRQNRADLRQFDSAQNHPFEGDRDRLGDSRGNLYTPLGGGGRRRDLSTELNVARTEVGSNRFETRYNQNQPFKGKMGRFRGSNLRAGDRREPRNRFASPQAVKTAKNAILGRGQRMTNNTNQADSKLSRRAQQTENNDTHEPPQSSIANLSQNVFKKDQNQVSSETGFEGSIGRGAASSNKDKLRNLVRLRDKYLNKTGSSLRPEHSPNLTRSINQTAPVEGGQEVISEESAVLKRRLEVIPSNGNFRKKKTGVQRKGSNSTRNRIFQSNQAFETVAKESPQSRGVGSVSQIYPPVDRVDLAARSNYESSGQNGPVSGFEGGRGDGEGDEGYGEYPEDGFDGGQDADEVTLESEVVIGSNMMDFGQNRLEGVEDARDDLDGGIRSRRSGAGHRESQGVEKIDVGPDLSDNGENGFEGLEDSPEGQGEQQDVPDSQDEAYGEDLGYGEGYHQQEEEDQELSSIRHNEDVDEFVVAAGGGGDPQEADLVAVSPDDQNRRIGDQEENFKTPRTESFLIDSKRLDSSNKVVSGIEDHFQKRKFQLDQISAQLEKFENSMNFRDESEDDEAHYSNRMRS